MRANQRTTCREPFRLGGEAAPSLPDWADRSVRAFLETVLDPTYPCFFASAAIGQGLVYATAIEPQETDAFADTTRRFVRECVDAHSLVVFVRPPSNGLDHAGYRSLFWNLLQALHDRDTRPWPVDRPTDPESDRWAFCFEGEPLFVFAGAPTHVRRRSRRLGPGLVLAIQPRRVFEGLEFDSPEGDAARQRIRNAAQSIDDAAIHPDLGGYGEPGHLEWKQFFLPDSDDPIEGRCPLRIRARTT